jgi:transposase
LVEGGLDLEAITGPIQARDARGTQPYHPAMLTGLLRYGYCVGEPSSRRIEAATYGDVAFRVIAGGTHPDHTVISEFRRVNLVALSELFLQVLKLCQRAGLVRLGHVALDGTKLKANASKHKAMSYERMLKTEAELKEQIAALLEKAERVDQAEDGEYGVGKKAEDLPEELRRRQKRLAAIREAKSALEAEAAAARALEKKEQADRAAQKAAAVAAAGSLREEARGSRGRSHGGASAGPAASSGLGAASRGGGTAEPDPGGETASAQRGRDTCRSASCPRETRGPAEGACPDTAGASRSG